MSAIVLTCGCKHEFQDAIHGKGQRVHNKSEDRRKAKCTVCDSVKNK